MGCSDVIISTVSIVTILRRHVVGTESTVVTRGFAQLVNPQRMFQG